MSKIQALHDKKYIYIQDLALQASKSAAIKTLKEIGRGNKNQADQEATNAMRSVLNESEYALQVVTGEGEMDEAPMLKIGEKLGKGVTKDTPDSDIKFDIAVDPLEGTNLCAFNYPNAITIIAIADRGTILPSPDMYMKKLAVGCKMPKDSINLDDNITKIIKSVAKVRGKNVTDMNVVMLKRDRHEEYASQIKSINARVTYIADGDILGAIKASSMGDCDMYFGIGGAPEGILSAACMKALNGDFFCKMFFEDKAERTRAKQVLGDKRYNAQLSTNEIISGNIVCSISGVTDGWMLDGVKVTEQFTSVNSLTFSNINGQSEILKSLSNICVKTS